mmetsp:Transcript_158958/g.506175  ORF Transcript_158958/g.506175 Transcript_158958/m.506175 type:complete len:113 (+) Transcript_158958:169-507(+)
MRLAADPKEGTLKDILLKDVKVVDSSPTAPHLLGLRCDGDYLTDFLADPAFFMEKLAKSVEDDALQKVEWPHKASLGRLLLKCRKRRQSTEVDAVHFIRSLQRTTAKGSEPV